MRFVIDFWVVVLILSVRVSANIANSPLRKPQHHAKTQR